MAASTLTPAANVFTAPTPETCNSADAVDHFASLPGSSAPQTTSLEPPITVTLPENYPVKSAKLAELSTTITGSETSWPPPTVLAAPAKAAPLQEVPAESVEPVKAAVPHAASEMPDQALSEMERAWRKLTPKPVPVPSRISTTGGIKKPSVAPVARRAPRRLAPEAKTVATPRASVADMGAPPMCSPSSTSSRSLSMRATMDRASLWWNLSGVSSAADVDFPLDPALEGV